MRIIRAAMRVNRGETHIGVVENRHQNPVEKYESERYVAFSPPGHDQRTANIRDHRPIKCQERHAQACSHTKHLIDDHIIRSNPTGKREHGQRFEEESY